MNRDNKPETDAPPGRGASRLTEQAPQPVSRCAAALRRSGAALFNRSSLVSLLFAIAIIGPTGRALSGPLHTVGMGLLERSVFLALADRVGR